MKNIANYITLIRIIFTIGLVFTSPLTATFYILYIASGISDIVDGIIARRLKINTAFGAKFDTIADGFFLVVVLYKILPVIEIKLELMIWFAVIALIKIIAVAIVCIKHNTFGSIHTHMNKITGFVLFISPLLLKHIDLKILCSCVGGVALVAAIEELVIDLIYPNLDLNRKGLFAEQNKEKDKINKTQKIKNESKNKNTKKAKTKIKK